MAEHQTLTSPYMSILIVIATILVTSVLMSTADIKNNDFLSLIGIATFFGGLYLAYVTR